MSLGNRVLFFLISIIQVGKKVTSISEKSSFVYVADVTGRCWCFLLLLSKRAITINKSNNIRHSHEEKQSTLSPVGLLRLHPTGQRVLIEKFYFRLCRGGHLSAASRWRLSTV